MSRRWILVATVVAVAVCALDARRSPQQPANRGDGGTIAGVVTTTDASAQPIRRVIVTVSSDEITRSLLTDDDGHFAFAGLPPSQYALTAEKAAFVKTPFGATAPGGGGRKIDVAAGEQVSGVAVRLPRGAVLAGTLRDVDGQLAADARVSAVRVGTGLTQQTWTNFRGEYRIYGLLPGDYMISTDSRGDLLKLYVPAAVMTTAEVDAALAALARGPAQPLGGRTAEAVSAQTSASTARQDATLSGYATVFYPGTTDRSAAVAVSVREGEERDGIDFALSFAGNTRVRGLVATEDGRPASEVMVSVSEGTNMNGLAHATSTRGDGTFEITNLAPGRYTILARATGRNVTTGPPIASPTAGWAIEEINAGADSSTAIALTLRAPMTFRGRLLTEPAMSAPPPTRGGARVSLIRQINGADAPGPPSASGAERPDGTFEVTGIGPGTYRIAVTGGVMTNTAWWLRAATSGERDLLDAPVEFGPEHGSVTNALLTLSAQHTSLAGTLRTAGGAAPDYYVIAFPTDPALWSSTSRRIRSVRPATNGQFEFRDLPPGNYQLAALTALDPETWRSSVFLEQAAHAAVPVAVTNGQRVVLDLQAAR